MLTHPKKLIPNIKPQKEYTNNYFYGVCIDIIFHVQIIQAQVIYAVKLRMFNDLSNGKNLDIHSKSKVDYVGVQQVAVRQFYQFVFDVNIWGSTLFFCGFTFDKALHWLTIYDFGRDINCGIGKCYWHIKEVGPCLRLPTLKYDECYVKFKNHRFQKNDISILIDCFHVRI